MRKRLYSAVLAYSTLVVLLLAPAAQATNNDGRGFYGATNDKVVTKWGLGLVIFFPLFVFTMSMIQRKLEKRKEARKAAHSSQMGDAHWRGGW
jgi:hypothetical protein